MKKNFLLKKGEDPKAFSTRLQKEIDDYKKSVLDLKTKEAVDEEEKKCVEELDKYDKYLGETEYELPEDVVYDGTRFSKKDIGSSILYFLNKMEVRWDFTLGMYQLSNLWKNDVSKLTFRELDSTLRTLDQVQFKGYREWKDILAINEYFKSVNDQFSIDTAGLIYLSQRHNAVMEQGELIKTIENASLKQEGND